MPATEELEEATATWELDEAGEKGARHAVPIWPSPPPISPAVLVGRQHLHGATSGLIISCTNTYSLYPIKNESNLVSDVTHLLLDWFFYGTDRVRDTPRYGLEKLLTRPKEPIEVRPFGANWEPTKEQFLWVGFEPSLSSVGRGTPTSTASQADGRGGDPPSRRVPVPCGPGARRGAVEGSPTTPP